MLYKALKFLVLQTLQALKNKLYMVTIQHSLNFFEKNLLQFRIQFIKTDVLFVTLEVDDKINALYTSCIVFFSVVDP